MSEEKTIVDLKKYRERRQLLGETVEAITDICNKIYRVIDRAPRESISDEDLALVKTFNELEKVNVNNLDILYPNRGVGNGEKTMRTLWFRNSLNDITEIPDE
tara:strand:+ start:1219 stop:1527 length:309 start_codon:yes stop_codon:yes gene_type:complete